MVLTPRRWRQVGGSHSADDGDNKARSPGRARRKPLKPLRAGMPGESGEPRGDYARMLFYFACEAAGASSTRHSPRPLKFRWLYPMQNSRGLCGEIAEVCCELSAMSLRGANATKQASFLVCAAMDCFATLAMTSAASDPSPVCGSRRAKLALGWREAPGGGC